MTVNEFLLQQDAFRVEVLTAIHQLIIELDKEVAGEVGMMMGKEMILYNNHGNFKYGLASGKEHMSLHILPMYASPQLHEKYTKLLTGARLQKGCINFKKAADMPLDTVKLLLEDCAKVNLQALMDQFKQNKTSRK